MSAPPNVATRVRHDAWLPAGADALGWYAVAVAALRARPDDDPTSWAHLAATHAAEAAHASWAFLPWQRRWLRHVEAVAARAVAEAGGPADWALPYWDPAGGGEQAAIPPAFRAVSGRDGTPNPLHAERAPGINDGARLRPRHTCAEVALGLVDFTGPPATSFGGDRPDPTRFTRCRGELERRPHDTVRGLVGGAGPMGTVTTAAQDPLLWCHLANIDRLWEVWLARGQGRANPSDPRWPDPGPDEHRYDDALPPVTRAQRARLAVTCSPPTPPPGPPRLLAASAHGLTLEGRAEVTVALDPEAAAHVAAILDDPAGGGRVLLALDHVDAPEPPGVVYDLHLGPVEDDASFVGVLGFGDAGVGPVDEVFDVTGLLDVRRRQGRWAPDDVRVALRPAGPCGRERPASRAATVAQVSIRST